MPRGGGTHEWRIATIGCRNAALFGGTLGVNANAVKAAEKAIAAMLFSLDCADGRVGTLVGTIHFDICPTGDFGIVVPFRDDA